MRSPGALALARVEGLYGLTRADADAGAAAQASISDAIFEDGAGRTQRRAAGRVSFKRSTK